MPSTLYKIIAGFIAGALATVLLHQAMYWALLKFGVKLPGAPWNMAPAPEAYGLPILFNQMFWGGLWGVVFAFMIDYVPGPNLLKGFLFGCIFPMLIGSWLVVALIKGRPILQGFLTDGDIWRLRPGFLLNGIAFGLGLGLLYPLLAGLMGGNTGRVSGRDY